jgi:hypothetical protein
MAMSKTSPMLPPPKQTSIARRKLLVLPSGKKKTKKTKNSLDYCCPTEMASSG